MDMLTLLLALSGIMWYLIGRAKSEIWGQFSFSRWCTIGAAAILGFAITFCFDIDLLYACKLVSEPSIMGKILTALTLMSGSSAISEIMGRLRGEH